MTIATADPKTFEAGNAGQCRHCYQPGIDHLVRQIDCRLCDGRADPGCNCTKTATPGSERLLLCRD